MGKISRGQRSISLVISCKSSFYFQSLSKKKGGKKVKRKNDCHILLFLFLRNPRVPCHSIPDIDLNAWKENNQGCNINGRQVAVGSTAVPTPCTSCVCTAQGVTFCIPCKKSIKTKCSVANLVLAPFQAQCASLRVTDCNQLLREWSKDAVLRDEVCTTQCGFLLRDTTTQSSGGSAPQDITFTTNGPPPNSRPGGRRLPPSIDLIPPPPRQLRRNRIPGFTGFKISPFLGG